MPDGNERAAPTAYTPDQASVYDSTRFTDPAGRQIHQEELKHLSVATRMITTESYLLEVGCGTGRITEELHSQGFQLTAADASGAMLDELRTKPFSSDVELFQAEAADLPFEDGRFDLTYSVRMLNQTESPAYALASIAEMCRVTRPDGLVLVEYMSADRPSLRGRRRLTTTLARRDVFALANQLGARVVRFDGAFLLGMTSRQKSPAWIRTRLPRLESWAPRWSDKYCSRCFVLLQVGSQRG